MNRNLSSFDGVRIDTCNHPEGDPEDCPVCGGKGFAVYYKGMFTEELTDILAQHGPQSCFNCLAFVFCPLPTEALMMVLKETNGDIDLAIQVVMNTDIDSDTFKRDSKLFNYTLLLLKTIRFCQREATGE